MFPIEQIMFGVLRDQNKCSAFTSPQWSKPASELANVIKTHL